jgi:hypothetical protein
VGQILCTEQASMRVTAFGHSLFLSAYVCCRRTFYCIMHCRNTQVPQNTTQHRVHRAVVDPIVALHPDFVLHTGDLVAHGHSAGEWEAFFEIERALVYVRLRQRALRVPAGGWIRPLRTQQSEWHHLRRHRRGRRAAVRDAGAGTDAGRVRAGASLCCWRSTAVTSGRRPFPAGERCSMNSSAVRTE